MTTNCDTCRERASKRTRRSMAWGWAVPIGLAIFAAGFVGSAIMINAQDQLGVTLSVVVIIVGALIACTGGMLGTIPRYVRAAQPDHDVDGDGNGGSRWVAPEPSQPPPDNREFPPELGEGPEWWPAFEPVLAGWLAEGAAEKRVAG